MDNFGFLKVAAAIPHVGVADCRFNAERIIALAEQAAQRGVEIVVFPEMAVTSYTLGDLVQQTALLDNAEEALEHILKATRKLPLVVIVGAPLRCGDVLYNCAAVISQGRVMGVVPKSCVSENRHFASAAEVAEEKQIPLCGQMVDFGANLTFAINGVEIGVEIGDDLFAVVPPSSRLAAGGAKVIFNLAAHAEVAGSHSALRKRVVSQSATCAAGYVYTSAGYGESTTDLLYAGNAFIAESGTILRESERFSLDEQLIVADIDIERIEFERRRNLPLRSGGHAAENTVIEMEVPEALRSAVLDRTIAPTPFIPHSEEELKERCHEILEIQSLGLARRLEHTQSKKVILGVSGGLDSTLALSAVVRTFDKLGLDRRGIIGITMPGFGTSGRTYKNALVMMEAMGITQREISIREVCLQHFKDIGLNPEERSVAYENAQARERTQILMDVANIEGGLVIGTGDLSELALGWATYNGDQMSMYGVNGSVPKTLVRHIVRYAAMMETDEKIRETLLDVVDTPVSPELLPADKEGKIAQKTEDLVGPYELHDFFLYNLICSGYAPSKILFLAEQAFEGTYDHATIHKWLTTFIRRFFSQQFKRSAMPDGVKTTEVSLSPRGEWQMPSDGVAKLWLEELEECE